MRTENAIDCGSRESNPPRQRWSQRTRNRQQAPSDQEYRPQSAFRVNHQQHQKAFLERGHYPAPFAPSKQSRGLHGTAGLLRIRPHRRPHSTAYSSNSLESFLLTTAQCPRMISSRWWPPDRITPAVFASAVMPSEEIAFRATPVLPKSKGPHC